MITLSDPTGKKKDPKGYEKVLMKTLGDRYGSVPQDKIDSFNKIISGGSLLENREEVSNALRYLVDNYGMSTDSLTKNIIDYNIEQKILGTLGSMAERAKIMAGMKVMGYKTGGALGKTVTRHSICSQKCLGLCEGTLVQHSLMTTTMKYYAVL